FLRGRKQGGFGVGESVEEFEGEGRFSLCSGKSDIDSQGLFLRSLGDGAEDEVRSLPIGSVLLSVEVPNVGWSCDFRRDDYSPMKHIIHKDDMTRVCCWLTTGKCCPILLARRHKMLVRKNTTSGSSIINLTHHILCG
ncbi:unnamed protein product, partial [Discosporangium mesarthrocarpum]